jgi:hypothetical protein
MKTASKAAPKKSPTPAPLPIAPILIAEKPTVTFEAQKDGKLRATYLNWDDAKVALPGEWFELRCPRRAS